MTGEHRLWRIRRGHDHLDAALTRDGASSWTLRFRLNDHPILVAGYGSRERAMNIATARLGELQRAGWTAHW